MPPDPPPPASPPPDSPLPPLGPPAAADPGACPAGAAPARPYHHGALAAALLAAAEQELAAHGVEGFSLRAVAKRAGVSHAAPAHHFGDAQGLLTALAAEGFRQFLATQRAREAAAEATPRARLLASGLGYVDFARARPALFRLIFSSRRPDFADRALHAAAEAAYQHLRQAVTDLGGGAEDVAGIWALAHGLADLLSHDRLLPLQSLAPELREAVLVALLERMLPGAP
jgi:AcrR family transcriptional regulator